MQRAEALAGEHLQGADGNQLAHHGAQLALAVLGAQTEGADTFVAALLHFVSQLATHDVHGVARSERDAAALLQPVHGGQQLARGIGRVPDFGRLQAVVAVVAVRAFLAKVAQQAHAAAIGGLGQAQQGVELAAHGLLEIFLGRAFVDHAALVDHVLQAVTHPGVGGHAVAPGAAGFLVITLNVFRHVEVRHKTHVGLVDAHAKGNGRHHHHALAAQELVLVGLAHLEIQARVVGQGLDAGLRQHGGHFFDPFARLAVHHAGLARMVSLNEAQQLGAGVLFLDNGVADVGPVKTADKVRRLLQLQPLHDVGARQRVSGGGERHARHAGITLVQHREGAVFGPEVMPPLAHAMRLVNGKQAELATFEQGVELRQKTRRGDPLGGGIQQRDFAAQQALLGLVGLFAAQRGIQKRGTDAGLVQRTHLVVHQRNQRRHHDGDAQPGLLARNGRNLVTQAFATAGGHQHQRVAPRHHMADDGLLWPAKTGVAKNLLQNGRDRQNRGRGRVKGSRKSNRTQDCVQGRPSKRQPHSVERWPLSSGSPSKPSSTLITWVKPALSSAMPASTERKPLRQSSTTAWSRLLAICSTDATNCAASTL